MQRWRIRLLLLLLLPPAQAVLGDDCLRLFGAMDKVAAQAGVVDGAPAPLTGLPFLRVDRVLAAFDVDALDDAAFETWLQRAARLDEQTRRLQIHNLSSTQRSRLGRFLVDGEGLSQGVARCRRQLLSRLSRNDELREQLRSQARVADDYVLWRRLFGLYWFTRLPVQWGIGRLHEETAATFARDLQPGNWRRYLGGGRGAEVKWRHDALGLPVFQPAQERALLDHWAPVWEVDEQGVFDRPGRPYRDVDGELEFQLEANEYRLLTYQRWRGRWLPSLVYLIWFSERPAEGAIDIYSGKLDGVFFRLTLDENGAPLMADTVHSCGCYHKFYARKGLRLRAEAEALPEPPLLAQALPRRVSSQRFIVRLSSARHFVQRIYVDRPGTPQPLAVRAYAELRRIDGRRPLFGDAGLIAGSERAERWLLWPMGIASPGGMRQWGRHPIAFVGRRHFDEPALIDGLFTLTH